MITKFLDCTLRDGSYVNNFSFTKKQTTNICKDLDKCNFDFIEIGHGVGLGANRLKKLKSKESDNEYSKAAKKGCNKSKWGVFAIPGIAEINDLKDAINLGAKFIRIGSDVNKYKEQKKFIEFAKKKEWLFLVTLWSPT